MPVSTISNLLNAVLEVHKTAPTTTDAKRAFKRYLELAYNEGVKDGKEGGTQDGQAGDEKGGQSATETVQETAKDEGQKAKSKGRRLPPEEVAQGPAARDAGGDGGGMTDDAKRRAHEAAAKL